VVLGAAAMNNPVALLRLLAVAEAISFLLLLLVAMPLKYVWGMPLWVLVAGSIHGCLFLALCAALRRAARAARWPPRRTALLFVAALLPAAPLLLDRRLREWAAEFAARRAGGA